MQNQQVENLLGKIMVYGEKDIIKVVDIISQSSLTKPQKAFVRKQWMRLHVHLSDKDWEAARNRTPKYKELKAGSDPKERTKKRFEANDHRPASKPAKKEWTRKDLSLFLVIEREDIDRELAKRFKTTIPAVQHIRRKIALAVKIHERMPKMSILELISNSEPVLRNIWKELNAPKNRKRNR